jgi:TfoX/Sxy family transcriptional regulator of competence genes
MMDADQQFESIADVFRADPHITTAKLFGGSALRVGQKVFACFYKGKLVLKLPRERVAALVQAGDAQHFDSGTGRPAKEWVAIEPSRWVEWQSLAEEAKVFVAAHS